MHPVTVTSQIAERDAPSEDITTLTVYRVPAASLGGATSAWFSDGLVLIAVNEDRDPI
jgi:hypothetical protein